MQYSTFNFQVALEGNEFPDGAFDAQTLMGILFTSYVVSFVFSPSIVSPHSGIGAKRSIVAGLALMSLFIISNLTSNFIITAICSVLSGLGASLIWTAEGHYITRHAINYAELKGISSHTALGAFSGMFYAIFQLFVVIFHIFGAIITDKEPHEKDYGFMVHSIFGAIALVNVPVAAFMIPGLHDPDGQDDRGLKAVDTTPPISISGTFTQTLRNAIDYRTMSLIPSNVAFGLLQEIHLDWYNNYLKDHIGMPYIGFIGAVMSALAMVQSVIVGDLCDRYGPVGPYIYGAGCNVVFALTIYCLDKGTIGLIIFTTLLLAGQNAVWGKFASLHLAVG